MKIPFFPLFYVFPFIGMFLNRSPTQDRKKRYVEGKTMSFQKLDSSEYFDLKLKKETKEIEKKKFFKAGMLKLSVFWRRFNCMSMTHFISCFLYRFYV